MTTFSRTPPFFSIVQIDPDVVVVAGYQRAVDAELSRAN